MLEKMVNYYLAPNLPQDKHAFFGRNGGVSEGIYASLNFNWRSQDKPENIETNLELIGKFYQLPGNRIMRPKQGHTATAVYIDTPSRYQIEADGVVTDRPDIVLGITTADCMSILLADYKHGIIAAVHAGWRGALQGVIENTVKIMLEKGADRDDIAAAAGPCLQKASFEVREDMRSLFVDQDSNNRRFFTPIGNDRYLCDLEAYARHRLHLLGIQNVSFSGIDTYTNPELYFSYRRCCHQGSIRQHADFPIQLSTIRR